MASQAMRFTTDCTASDGQSIQQMIDGATDITRKTFLRYVDRESLADVERQLGYAGSRTRNSDLRMTRDWHVSYHRSRYQGQPCVYFRWSAIEHIFTKGIK